MAKDFSLTGKGRRALREMKVDLPPQIEQAMGKQGFMKETDQFFLHTLYMVQSGADLDEMTEEMMGTIDLASGEDLNPSDVKFLLEGIIQVLSLLNYITVTEYEDEE